MSIAIVKADGDEILAVINLSSIAAYGYKRYEPMVNSRGFKIISSSGMDGPESYKLGYKKGSGIMDLGTIIFSSDNSHNILKNAFSDYDFVLTKISSGNEPIPVEKNPKPEKIPENGEKPENSKFPQKPQPEKNENPEESVLDEIRQKCVDQAKKHINSNKWSYFKIRTSFDKTVTFYPLEPKCNLFVYEVLKQCGIDLGLPNDYVRGEALLKRPYVCSQWYKEEVPNFKCIGKGREALNQAKPGDIITQGKHIGIISGYKKTISASSKVNKIVENDFGWREDEQDNIKVFRYMGEGYTSK